ncbi:MAG: hypothetical protein WAW07_03160 [Bacteroidales bacterium]
MTNSLRYILLFSVLLLAVSCGTGWQNAEETGSKPVIFPDYCDVVIPSGIAPLNFRVEGEPRSSIAMIEGSSETLRIRGEEEIIIPAPKWKKLLGGNSGGSLKVTLYAGYKDGWKKYEPFSIDISSDPIDPWIVYRLIAPGYETWSEMGIYQRELSSFEQRTIIDNRLLPGACMNCHSFRANNPADMMFHLRGNVGGTMLVMDGEAVKLNTKTSETISNCVYPYWHPSEDFIAYSVNNIQQVFHSVSDKRIEVFDSKSDIVVFDIRNNRLISTSRLMTEESFETFPCFSHDGRKLFFCSARKGKQPEEYDRIKYSLCSIDFDPETGRFGEKIDTLVSSDRTGRSVSFPRISPDGTTLVFTLSDYGNFSIWHREADLYRLDMKTRNYHPVDVVNSPESESYHSWSSNSRWMIFSSRRIDGLYTRPFIAHMDEDGTFSKPFMVPQKDPGFYDSCLRSFNIPEFVTGKVATDGRAMLKIIGSPAKDVNFALLD